MSRGSGRAAMLALGSLIAVQAMAADPKKDISRGGYLVAVGGCGDCHTPLKMGPTGPMPDVSRGLSGHPEGMALPPAPAPQGPWVWGGAGTNTAFWGPWGVSYSVNLTPDRQTGIGAWRAGDFMAAMRTGKHLGTGRPILPPMPWQSLSRMTDADLRAMFAYLVAQPAIRNLVPEDVPPQQKP